MKYIGFKTKFPVAEWTALEHPAEFPRPSSEGLRLRRVSDQVFAKWPNQNVVW